MTRPFSLCYSDDNKKNTFNNDGIKGHRLYNVTCKQTCSTFTLISGRFGD